MKYKLTGIVVDPFDGCGGVAFKVVKDVLGAHVFSAAKVYSFKTDRVAATHIGCFLQDGFDLFSRQLQTIIGKSQSQHQ